MTSDYDTWRAAHSEGKHAFAQGDLHGAIRLLSEVSFQIAG
jgi:hypothetical protein